MKIVVDVFVCSVIPIGSGLNLVIEGLLFNSWWNVYGLTAVLRIIHSLSIGTPHLGMFTRAKRR